MASETRTLKVVIAGDAKSARDALKVLGTGLDEADRKAKHGIDSWNGYWHAFNGVLGAIGLGVAGAAVGITALGIKTASAMEQSTVGFETMLGSAQKAQDFMKQLQDFAMRTPFEMQGVVSSSQKLLAMGFTAQQVIPTMTAVGDAVSAVGGDAGVLDRVVIALGQMQAKGKISSEEMMQLTEAGIPAWQMLADKIGVSVPDAMKKVTAGAVSSAVGIGALTEGMEKKYGGLMTKQSGTMAGLWSNLKDTMSIASAKIVEPLVPLIKEWMPKLIVYAQATGDVLAKKVAPAVSQVVGFLVTMAKFVKNNHDWLIPLIAVLGTVATTIYLIVTAVKIWTAVQAALDVVIAANPIGILIVAIAGLVALVVYLWNTNAGFRDALIGIWRDIQVAVMAVVDFFTEMIPAAWGKMLSATKVAWSAVTGAVSNAWNMMTTAAVTAVAWVLTTTMGLPGKILSALGNLGKLLYNAGKDILQGLIDGIESKISAVKDKFSFVTKLIPSWKGPADKDAVLLKPAGQLIMGGLVSGIDAGTPAVKATLAGLTTDIAGTANAGAGRGLANASLNGTAGGVRSGVNVTVNVAGNVTSERDLAKAITTTVRDEITRIGKRNGGRTGV